MIETIPDWVKWSIGLILLREVLAYVFDWQGGWLDIADFFETRRHNAAIDKKWIEDGRPIVSTTIGWRRDPFNKEDGYRDDGLDKGYYGDGHSYSKLIRGGTDEYREQFAKDVDKSSK
jgi:hypothetical protein